MLNVHRQSARALAASLLARCRGAVAWQISHLNHQFSIRFIGTRTGETLHFGSAHQHMHRIHPSCCYLPTTLQFTHNWSLSNMANILIKDVDVDVDVALINRRSGRAGCYGTVLPANRYVWFPFGSTSTGKEAEPTVPPWSVESEESGEPSEEEQRNNQNQPPE